ncbi:MAG: agmatinase family protein [Oligoflexia bacterium]|nr:agmatinase family protein [Oligoflexia bacterium]
MNHFDPNGPASDKDGIFGLNYTINESKLVLLPVPWEVTTSYGGGTSQGPRAIFKASKQIDLYDLELGSFYKYGICMDKMPADILKLNKSAKSQAQKILKVGGIAKTLALKTALKEVNQASIKVNEYVYKKTRSFLAEDKIVGLIGGDHSTPYGSIQAYLEKYPQMGILHIDAHADLRKAYEGFEFSHASIMYNVVRNLNPAKLVQVGIRDFCEEEFNFIKSSGGKIKTYFDEDLAKQKFSGSSWLSICEKIISDLPKEVYISFDIDGLDPKLCPNTGTPVPGGLEFQEALMFIKMVAKAGKKIVGFDLNEVSPGTSKDEWDANVGARMLFKLCGWSLETLL